MIVSKLTKRDKLVAISEVLTHLGEAPELVEFVAHEIELLDKRKTADRKPTKAQLANASIKEAIVSELFESDSRTATQVAESHGISVQKASQLLRQLVAEGLVTRNEGKGKEKTTFAA